MLYAVEQLPDLTGRHVAVIGQGSIGLLFSYVAKAAGAAHVTGVDPVDRDAVGQGVRRRHRRARHQRPVGEPPEPGCRPDIVIEAVGHQVATLEPRDRGGGVRRHGLLFRCPDDDSYPISMRTMLRNNLTLKSGVTLDRRRVLAAADEFARAHPELLPDYLTHTFGVDEVQAAFELACRPAPERIKIAIVE